MVAGSLKSQIVSVIVEDCEGERFQKKVTQTPKDGEPVSSLADLEPCGSIARYNEHFDDGFAYWNYWEFVVCSYSRHFISFYSDLF